MKQNQAVILIMGIVILGGIGLAVFFQKDISNLFSKSKSAVKEQIKDENRGPIFPTPYPRRVRTAIFIDGYSAVIENEQDIIIALENMKVFGRKFVNDQKQTTGQKPLELIEVAIRDTLPTDGKKPNYGNFTYVYLGEGTIQVNFVLTKQQLDNPDIGDILLKNTLGASYQITYSKATKVETDSEVEKAYNGLKEKNGEYIVISKK